MAHTRIITAMRLSKCYMYELNTKAATSEVLVIQDQHIDEHIHVQKSQETTIESDFLT